MTLTPMLPVTDGRLPEQPVKFLEGPHKYVHTPTQRVMKYSVTNVVSHFKDPRDLAAIEAKKHIWAPRGLTVHACLEHHFTGEGELNPGAYADWVEPLLAHPTINQIEPIACEYRMCSVQRSLGGSFDLLGRWRGKTVLFDLKTQGSASASPYDTSVQLGGYLQLLLDCTTGIWVDEIRTIWCRPGKTTFGQDQGVDRCSVAFLEAWEQFIADQPEDAF